MSDPTVLLDRADRGMRQDEPRDRMMRGSVWDMLDYIPGLGAALRKRGGWAWGSDSLSAAHASTTYPIATISNSKYQSIAQAFVAYVLSPEGEQVLKTAGFEQP